MAVQGYLAQKKQPPPQDHHRILGTVGSLEGGVSYERGAPVAISSPIDTALTPNPKPESPHPSPLALFSGGPVRGGINRSTLGLRVTQKKKKYESRLRSKQASSES